MIFFGDDTEFISKVTVRKVQDVFCIGGFGISNISSIKKVEELIESVKTAYKIPFDLPLKWNMKDTKVKQLYQKIGHGILWKQIVDDFDYIRKEVLQELPSLGVRVMISSIRNVGQQTKNQLYEWGFTALLQRFALASKGEPINFVVLDWESAKRDIYCEIYQSGYYKGMGRGGESYISGPLRSIPAIPYLSFSVTVFNPILQLADFIVGCTADFLEWCFTNKNKKVVESFFPYIKQCLDRSYSGQILRWGLIIQPKEDQEVIFRKLQVI